MTDIDQQLEKDVFELIGNSTLGNPLISVNALEAACLILDNKFGKDFHKKNPKLAVRFAGSIMKNIRMNDAVLNGLGGYQESIRGAVLQNDLKSKETLFEDYADSFRF